MMNSEASGSSDLELIPDGEAAQIANIVSLTTERMKARFQASPPIRRGVHPKDHGCVKASFTVLDSLHEKFRVGVFSRPGQRFDAFVRFSNADVKPGKSDSAELPPPLSGNFAHGSRGMAVKLLRVAGTPLLATNLTTTRDPVNQDFLMINQPVFAFANIEDYEALSQSLVDLEDEPDDFFIKRLGSADAEVRKRAEATKAIVERIAGVRPPPFQDPPLSPLGNRYFSAAPFLFGKGRAMKFSAKPMSSTESGDSDFADPHYLRAGLRKRLKEADGRNIEFEFQVQVRSAADLDLKTDIENMCTEWEETKYPFETVATISIPPQNIDAPERIKLCEDLIFSPWHGLRDHRPLGGINRLRRAVYEESVGLRHGSGALANAGVKQGTSGRKQKE